jgi:hypothetical protein
MKKGKKSRQSQSHDFDFNFDLMTCGTSLHERSRTIFTHELLNARYCNRFSLKVGL